MQFPGTLSKYADRGIMCRHAHSLLIANECRVMETLVNASCRRLIQEGQLKIIGGLCLCLLGPVTERIILLNSNSASACLVFNHLFTH